MSGGVVGALAVLHPLEYIAMNALAGGTRGAYDNFELDYWSAAATEALRRLERKFDYDPAVRAADSPPSIVICIPWREHLVDPMLKRPWAVETDPDHADFIIATERSRCADNKPVVLIDEVKRFDRTFAWVYARRPQTRKARSGREINASYVFGGCASVMAILRASVVINSVLVRSLRCRLSSTIRLMQTQI